MKSASFIVLLGFLRPIVAWQSESLRPFHHAFPVHDLALAKHFYGQVLGLREGRSSAKWQDYSLDGHQIVCHLVGSDYRCQDYVNPVDGDTVPVPHSGLAMTVEQFHLFVDRLRNHGVKFIIEPHLRFKVSLASNIRAKFSHSMMEVIYEYGKNTTTPSLHEGDVGQAGEQWTMFFKDPSGNNLEFKAMTNPSNLFAKYNVDEFDYGDGEREDHIVDGL